MALSDVIAADVVKLFSTDDFGTAATYTAPDGTAAAITVVAFSEYTEDQDQQGVNVRVRRRGCMINRAEVAMINQQATVTIGGVEYSISRMLSQDDQISVVELSRHELVEHTRPGYRRR